MHASYRTYLDPADQGLTAIPLRFPIRAEDIVGGPRMSLDLKSNVHQINLELVKPSICLIYEFENFRLDAEHLMLYRDEEEISLPPKQVETLLALIEKNGEIISKDVLMSRLWGDAAVEEANLIQNIYVLRKILGDTVDGRPMIETLRRRGYRFNGELREHAIPPAGKNGGISSGVVTRHRVELVATESGSHFFVADQSATDQSRRKIPSIQRKGVIAILTTIFLVTVVVSGYFLFGSGVSTAGDNGRKKIVVLPLKAIDTTNRSELYENGIADEMISRLSTIPGFAVRPLGALREYGPDEDPLKAAREQKVDLVLESTYQIANGKIKINSRLINVDSGDVEDTYRFEKEASGIFAVQDAVATDLATGLMKHFGVSASGKPKARGTDSEEAYRLYLQGVYFYNRVSWRDNKETGRGLESFDRAVAIDPNYAKAWAGKALAHRELGMRDSADAAQAYARSMQAAERALTIDPNIADAHTAICSNKVFYEYNFAGAAKECRVAIELDPASSAAHSTYSQVAIAEGRTEEGLAEIRTAIDLDPNSYLHQRLYGVHLFFARRYDEAEAHYNRLREMNPNERPTYEWMIRVLQAKGDEAQAFEWIIKKLELEQFSEEAIAEYRAAYQRSGWPGVLRERIKWEISRPDYHKAAWYAMLGEKDKAFEHLENYFQQRGWLLVSIERNPEFDSLRDDPRYADLLRRMKGN